jgi:type II secretory pathway pseudopilin PulG
MTQRPRLDRSRATRGMTLLEVLVACGILVVGLASIAAMLPAAGSRLGQAALEDRAGNVAGNALAQARSAGAIAADVFSNPNRAVAFGRGIDTLPTVDNQRFAAAAPTLGQRIDANRGFMLEDEVQFTPASTTETPVNDFTDGRRSFKEAVCWGATIVPSRFPAAPGGSATVSIAVARKTPAARAIALQNQGGGLYVMATPDEAVRKTFLKGCSYAVVPPADATKGPRWYRITASWKADNPTLQVFIAFDGTDFETFAGANPTVIGFDGLVRVDEHEVVLQ